MNSTFTIRVSLILMFFGMFSAKGQSIAFDSAGTTAYNGGSSNGTNGGNGFNPWVINAGANTGTFTGNPANDGMGSDGIGTKAFGIYATGSAYLNASRSFKQSLQIGDELSFYWAMNFDAGAGNKGFDINSGTSTVFNVNNGNASPNIISSSGTALRVYGTKPMLVKLKRTGADLYTFSMTGRADGENYSTTINTTLPINGISFYIGNQNSNEGQRNIYFNHFNITSVTSTVIEPIINKGLAVYPNPVSSGSTMQLSLSNYAAGNYHVALVSLAGIRVLQTQINHPGGNSRFSVKLNNFSPCLYFAEITSPSGKRDIIKVFVK